MPFLGLMGCKRFIQLSQRRLCGSKLAPAPICGHILPLGPCARRRWTSAEKQQILALRAPPLVSAMAWLNGLPASVLLMWRRLALEGRLFELTQRGSR
jgi:transposase-like protein